MIYETMTLIITKTKYINTQLLETPNIAKGTETIVIGVIMFVKYISNVIFPKKSKQYFIPPPIVFETIAITGSTRNRYV